MEIQPHPAWVWTPQGVYDTHRPEYFTRIRFSNEIAVKAGSRPIYNSRQRVIWSTIGRFSKGLNRRTTPVNLCLCVRTKILALPDLDSNTDLRLGRIAVQAYRITLVRRVIALFSASSSHKGLADACSCRADQLCAYFQKVGLDWCSTAAFRALQNMS
jgi:hypothetical protein